MDSEPVRRQRVGAYAVIVREDQILLSRLADSIAGGEFWSLPGGGLDHGEDPHDAVIRECYEETGLAVQVSRTAHVYSAHRPETYDDRAGGPVDHQALRIVYAGWVPPGAPEPHVVEEGGSTVEAAWHPVADVLSGRLPVVPQVTEALADYQPQRRQRLSVYARILRGGGEAREVLLTRVSVRGHHSGQWLLPGGGLEHGESPVVALRRETLEETGLTCEVGQVLGVHDRHFTGTAPSGRTEDFHGVHLVYEAWVAGDDADTAPRVAEADGTTDEAAWVPVSGVVAEEVPTLDVVRWALDQP